MRFSNFFPKLGLYLGFAALAAGLVFATFFFFYLRYVPPIPAAKIDQGKNFNLIKNRTGLVFPAKSKILVASDSETRDGTTGFFYWIVFSEESINTPQKRLNRGFKPDLTAHVRTIESEIAPYKIKDPTDIRYDSWQYNDIDSRIYVVSARNGFYVFLETYKSK